MIGLGKKYRTRDGREVRIYAVDCGGCNPVHGAINTDGLWFPYSWHQNGEHGKHDCADIIEVPPARWHPVIAMKGDARIHMSHLETRQDALAFQCGVLGWETIDAWLDPRSGK